MMKFEVTVNRCCVQSSDSSPTLIGKAIAQMNSIIRTDATSSVFKLSLYCVFTLTAYPT